MGSMSPLERCRSLSQTAEPGDVCGRHLPSRVWRWQKPRAARGRLFGKCAGICVCATSYFGRDLPLPLCCSPALEKIATDRGLASGSIPPWPGHPLADSPRTEIRDWHPLNDVHPRAESATPSYYFVNSGEEVTGMSIRPLPAQETEVKGRD